MVPIAATISLFYTQEKYVELCMYIYSTRGYILAILGPGKAAMMTRHSFPSSFVGAVVVGTNSIVLH